MSFKYYKNRRRPAESGQTLILALLVLIIVLIMGIVIFDVGNIVRGKIKGQTAVDAAALTGATWQMHSLNLIGELNLIKATNVLISDTLYGIGADVDNFTKMKNEDEYHDAEGNFNSIEFDQDLIRVAIEKAKLADAVNLLSQMQTRISFVGPLLGFGAAQQAAKNNGLDYHEEAGEMCIILYNDIMSDDLYGNPTIAPPVINGYTWRMPYAGMIYSILDIGGDIKDPSSLSSIARGVAVGTRLNWVGEPSITASPASDLTPYLSSKRFYDAIHANYWCDLRDVLTMNFSGSWWGIFDCEYNGSFMGESEILPLHIDFSSQSSAYYDAESVISLIAADRDLTPLGESFDPYNPYPGNDLPQNPDDTDLRSNIIPEIQWCLFDNQWTAYSDDVINSWNDFLRDNFKPGLEYESGALAYFEGSQPTRTMMGNNVKTGNALDFNSQGGTAAYQREQTARIKNAEARMRSSSTPDISMDAEAKPIGRIRDENGQYHVPFAAGRLVLPVFTHSALIPVALETAPGMSSIDVGWYYYLTEYIPILGSSSSLQSAKQSAMAAYPNHWKYFKYYHEALEKLNDPIWRNQGLAWLEAPATWYIDKVTGNKIVTSKNRDHCDDWPTGGGGGGRPGPGKLH